MNKIARIKENVEGESLGTRLLKLPHGCPYFHSGGILVEPGSSPLCENRVEPGSRLVEYPLKIAYQPLCLSCIMPWQEVERKHEAMLQMYGEKAEEAEELKLDIDDLKTMYRQQVNNII